MSWLTVLYNMGLGVAPSVVVATCGMICSRFGESESNEQNWKWAWAINLQDSPRKLPFTTKGLYPKDSMTSQNSATCWRLCSKHESGGDISRSEGTSWKGAESWNSKCYMLAAPGKGAVCRNFKGNLGAGLGPRTSIFSRVLYIRL